MSVFAPVNPSPFLQSLVGQPVIVRLKWGQEYKGVLVSTDQYMNIQLVDAEEFQDGNSLGVLPNDMLIRCNNVLYVRELKKTDEGAMDTSPSAAPAAREDGHVSEDEQMEEGEQGS
ncbi:Manganese transporter smf1 [Coemansia biformis]|uniref:Sm protein F n=1 Tax=Coemansia biformis TaxID=1286918 RepID=A0A9W8CYZ2_9FUNG|nr:Manganese transporter smf1 [Coemansia biformis]